MNARGTATTTTHFAILDGLRGLAAFCVVLYHLTINPTNLVHVPAYGGFFAHSYLAVDFFFLLSGFVLAHAYEARLQNGYSFVEFCRARIIRLYPMFFAGLVLGAIATILINPGTFGISLFFQQALFIPHYHHGVFAFPYNLPAWSLMFELIINVVFAFFLPWLRTNVMLIAMAISALLLAGCGWIHDGINFGGGHPGLPLGLPRVTLSFFYGVLLFRAYHAGKLPQLPTSAIGVFLALGLLLALPIGGGHLGDIYDMLCLLLGFPAIIIFCLPITKKTAFFSIAGNVSYPLYEGSVPPASPRWPGQRQARLCCPDARSAQEASSVSPRNIQPPLGGPDNSLSGWRSEAEPQEVTGTPR